MAELARRTTICEMRRAGNSVSDIIKSTGYAKLTVYRVVAAFDAEGKVQRSQQWSKENQKIPCRAEKDVEKNKNLYTIHSGTALLVCHISDLVLGDFLCCSLRPAMSSTSLYILAILCPLYYLFHCCHFSCVNGGFFWWCLDTAA